MHSGKQKVLATLGPIRPQQGFKGLPRHPELTSVWMATGTPTSPGTSTFWLPKGTDGQGARGGHFPLRRRSLGHRAVTGSPALGDERVWYVHSHEAPEPSGTAHKACAQVGEGRMTGRQGCQTCQLASLGRLHTPRCLLSSWARSLSPLLHTRTIIVLHQLLRGLNQRIHENHLAQCLVVQSAQVLVL